MLENQAKFIYLGIGSNLGNRKKNIENAKYKLIENKIEILESSHFYESFSWPNSKNPKFLNVVLKTLTEETPYNLLKICKNIEAFLGRKKSAKNAPRICDIDILDYKGELISTDIELPHPRMHKRNFVLLPLFEINKNWAHPGLKLHIRTLISLISNRDIRSIKQI